MKIQLQATCFDGVRKHVVIETGEQLPNLFVDVNEMPLIEKAIGHLKRNKKAYIAAVYTLALWTLPGSAFAAPVAGMSGGMNIILLMQKASFWVGMGVTIWGLIEMGLDAPGWKARVFKGVLLYVGVLLVPLVFLELQHSLQVDVWDQINRGNGVKVNGGQ